MTVKVNNESNISFLANLLYEIFDRGDFRTVNIFFCSIPFSIKILSRKVSPVMPKYHSIRIDHRDDVDHIIFKQKISLFGLTQQLVHYPFTNI